MIGNMFLNPIRARPRAKEWNFEMRKLFDNRFSIVSQSQYSNMSIDRVLVQKLKSTPRHVRSTSAAAAESPAKS